MEPQHFDALAKSVASGVSRRRVTAGLGAGSLAAGLAAALGRGEADARRPGIQAATCRLTLVATVQLGPSAGVVLSGTTPGELRGDLEFAIGDGGVVDSARLRLADGTEFPVVGQVTGRAVHLSVEVAADRPLILVGTAAQDLSDCTGPIDGLLTGPQPGDLGDWHATATPL